MTDHAQLAYDSMAPIYDSFNRQNDYPAWFGVLLPRLERLGLHHGALLDVACGTGKAVDPMLRRSWVVLGSDISPEMVEIARRKHPDVPFDVADVRELPVYRPQGFQLVWALNDPLNYLLEDGDLQLALEAMGGNLAPEGMIVFDLNTLALFASNYDPHGGLHRGDDWEWRPTGLSADGIYEAELSGENVEAHWHRERHYSVPEVQRAILDAGLEPVAAMGQREDETGLHIEDGWSEETDAKILHVAKLAG